AGMAVHPPVRGLVARSESALLRRSPDGPLVPAHVRPRALRAQGDGRPLDAARADVDGRKSTPQRPRVLSVAEHGALLRPDLGQGFGLTEADNVADLTLLVGVPDGADLEQLREH